MPNNKSTTSKPRSLLPYPKSPMKNEPRGFGAMTASTLAKPVFLTCRTEEIALALADLHCYEIHAQVVYEPLRHEIENGLLDEHGDELSSL